MTKPLSNPLLEERRQLALQLRDWHRRWNEKCPTGMAGLKPLDDWALELLAPDSGSTENQ